MNDSPLMVTRWPAAKAGKVMVEASVTVLDPVALVGVTGIGIEPTEMLGVTFPLLSSVAVARTLVAWPVIAAVVKPSVNLPV